MNILDASAVVLARQKVVLADARVRKLEEQTNSLWSRARRGEVSQEHYVLKSKQLAEEMTRAVDVECDALRDYFEATQREAGREPYENVDDDLGALLSLSVAGGVR